jgi:thiamine-monophosphate kinase
MYNLPMKLSQIGEFGLIEIITEFLNRAGVSDTPEHDILIGVGDDAAAWRSQGLPQLGTTDTMVQDVHFSLDTITWQELGWKALAVNISDIAAMGGIPKHALVSLGLPQDTEVEQVIELYRGMAEIAKEFALSIIGGDVIKAPLVIISPSVVGVAGNNILTRSAALPGDLIAVTGYLGSSAAGLRMLKAGLELDEETARYLRRAHLCPLPRVREGEVLARHGVRAAIDLSDGLIADLGKVCQASKVGARVMANKMPIHPLVRAAFERDCLRLALSGGEDYELLFTARGDVIERTKSLMSSPVTVIGEIVVDEPGRVTLLDEEGKAMAWEGGGWEHFKDERIA